jgi:hypothetical protein
MRHVQSRVNSRPLSSAEREELGRAVSLLGERTAVERLGLGRQTLARALAGLGLYPGTHALIRERLASLSEASPAGTDRGGA